VSFFERDMEESRMPGGRRFSQVENWDGEQKTKLVISGQ
jgi:hypothetical protein